MPVRRVIDDEFRRECLELYRKGKSIREIAREKKCGVTTVYRALKEAMVSEVRTGLSDLVQIDLFAKILRGLYSYRSDPRSEGRCANLDEEGYCTAILVDEDLSGAISRTAPVKKTDEGYAVNVRKFQLMCALCPDYEPVRQAVHPHPETGNTLGAGDV